MRTERGAYSYLPDIEVQPSKAGKWNRNRRKYPPVPKHGMGLKTIIVPVLEKYAEKPRIKRHKKQTR